MQFQEEIKEAVEEGRQSMQDAIDHLNNELATLRTGKASPSMLQGILVEYYGNPTPLNQVANISLADARTISIQPWEKKMLPTIERAIFEANLGLTPMNDGEFIRINIPPLTEERRIELVKQAKSMGEETKVSLRNARHKMMDFLKRVVKDGYPEDLGHRKEEEVEKMVKDFSEKVDKMIELKEKDIMTV